MSDAEDCSPCEAIAHEGGDKAHDHSKEAEPDAGAGRGTLQMSHHPERHMIGCNAGNSQPAVAREAMEQL